MSYNQYRIGKDGPIPLKIANAAGPPLRRRHRKAPTSLYDPEKETTASRKKRFGATKETITSRKKKRRWGRRKPPGLKKKRVLPEKTTASGKGNDRRPKKQHPPPEKTPDTRTKKLPSYPKADRSNSYEAKPYYSTTIILSLTATLSPAAIYTSFTTPSIGLRISFSIFIATSTQSGIPAFTSCPAST